MLQQVERKFKSGWTVCAVLGPRLGRASVLVSALTLIALLPAAAQQNAVEPIAFNIASQPLSDALYKYSSATGIEVLVPGDILAHRQSSSVVGVLAPDEALRVLLAGSGLVPRSAGRNAFTLVLAAPDTSASNRIPPFPQYSAALQAAVTRVLCQLRETQPGDYRVAARLWVGPTGEVTRVGVLGSTGDFNRDATLSALLKRVVIGMPPPPNLRQPTTVVVLPRQEAAGCGVGVQGSAP